MVAAQVKVNWVKMRRNDHTHRQRIIGRCMLRDLLGAWSPFLVKSFSFSLMNLYRKSVQ